MAIWSLALFAGLALGHSGIRTIIIDGQAYPPFESRIDHLLGPVKRIEWSHDVGPFTFDPITNFMDPALACRGNAKAPALKAPARAGADIELFWTPITRMHHGPILAYLGNLPTPTTPPQQVKFFKIYEKGFDAALDKWANQIASDNNDTYHVQIPSDIKPGTYVLRTELIALHGNFKELKTNLIREQIQVYNHCFNIEVIGNGSATPEGVTFPGAYKPTDFGFTFRPFMTYGNDTTGATEQNSKYVPPGPPLYKGRYDPPTGPRPVVKETGAYPPGSDIAAEYQSLIKTLEAPALQAADYINAKWPGYKADPNFLAGFAGVGLKVIAETLEVMMKTKARIEALKIAAVGKEI